MDRPKQGMWHVEAENHMRWGVLTAVMVSHMTSWVLTLCSWRSLPTFQRSLYVRSGVVTVVNIWIQVLWVVMLCSVVSQLECCFHLQGRSDDSWDRCWLYRGDGGIGPV